MRIKFDTDHSHTHKHNGFILKVAQQVASLDRVFRNVKQGELLCLAIESPLLALFSLHD